MTITLNRVRELAPAIRERSSEIEEARRLPLDLVSDLRSAGCFRMLVPASYGGDELTFSQAFEVIEELACADGSTGWTTMIGCSSPLLLGLLPKATFDAVYADGPDVIGAGALAPRGQSTPVQGGYCVSGQWAYASGCQHASWVLGQSIVLDDGKPRLLPNGMPDTRVVVFPSRQVELLDTWHVAGLRGTGSHDFRVHDVLCPEEYTFSLFTGTPAADYPAYAIPPLAQLPQFIAAAAIGIGRGALKDLGELAAGGKRRVAAYKRLAESAVFQDKLGEADATLRAARALLHSDANSAWAKTSRGEALTLLERVRLRTTATQVATMVAHVVDTAYTAGGGTSVYESSPLQRRLRDIHALTQHIGVGRDAFEYAGALLAGEEPDPRRPL